MIFEIVAYDSKVIPLKTALCKLTLTEKLSRNSFGIVFHSQDQVKDLISQLMVYAESQNSNGGEE